MTRKHNQINYAIRRTLANYGIGYTVEPKGLPLKDTTEESRGPRAQDGPDGLLSAGEGLTAVEVHCAHQRLFHSTGTNYDSVTTARNTKTHKYRDADFETKYPGIKLVIFTVSTGGVILDQKSPGPSSIRPIKKHWLPYADNEGRGLLRMLYVEVAFAVARSIGHILELAKMRK
jgi:hypothetical protein